MTTAIAWIVTALLIVLFAYVAFLVFASIRRTRFGVNLKTVHCPQCSAAMPAIRLPTSVSQAVWGGWTCPHCGTNMDRWGRRI
jgi:hypothetical protein